MLRIVILHHSPIIDMDVNRILTEIILIILFSSSLL
ncbi:hypothetical protein CUMW_148350 [Citrus unshiu]|uniref:Uncharacterized protein n=1 Tax=Citrus unshiu TaxID=55188 RepID=A0A2H5PLU0_CITUN|nr:hypothetical protein CUMW_148350 [Citrus unshiu]